MIGQKDEAYVLDGHFRQCSPTIIRVNLKRRVSCDDRYGVGQGIMGLIIDLDLTPWRMVVGEGRGTGRGHDNRYTGRYLPSV